MRNHTRTLRAVWVAGAVAGLGLLVGGCAQDRGVNVLNDTGKIVKVEMLSIDSSGGSNVYSKGQISPGGTFVNAAQSPVSGLSMRARFFFDEPQGMMGVEDNWVMLGLPTDKTAFYTLERTPNGRLRAVPEKRGRPSKVNSGS